MKKKKLYIHIGTHKTGSTTIQSILENEKKKLLNEGILYLGLFYDHAKGMKSLEEIDEYLIKDFRQEVKKRIAQYEDRNPHTLVTSNEKFSGHDRWMYRNSTILAKTLWQIFEPFGFDIKIIVYLRRQDKFLESAYKQKVKRDSSFTFDVYLKEETEDIYNFYWDSFLDSYAEFFGKENIIVRSFDKKNLLKKNSLIQGFGNIIGSEYLKKYSEKTVKNEGYSRDLLEIVRLSNEHLTKQQRREMRYLLKDVDFPNNDTSFFSLEERKNLLSHFDESNSKIAREYLNDPSGELFSTSDLNKEYHKKTYEGLTPEAVAISFTKIILALNKQLTKEIEETRKMEFTRRVRRKLRQIFGKSIK